VTPSAAAPEHRFEDEHHPMGKLSRQEKLLAFSGVLTVLFLTSLNLTVVGTALPRIIAELQGFQLYAWAFTAYSLTQTVSLPVYGRLSDLYGRKKVLLFGILLFSASSALGGFAQNMPQLIVVRALQGLGGGALTSMAFSAIGDIFTPRERGKYNGFTGAVFGISSVVGPLVGGVITDTIGWRWVFFVNVPIALVAFYVINRFFPGPTSRASGKVDLPGTALLVLGVVPLLLALTFGGVDLAWTSAPMLALFAMALVMLVLFVVRQRMATDPILDLQLFKDRTFTLANIGGFLTGAGMFGAIIYLPLYIQGVQGASAAASGFALAPLMLGMVLSSTIIGLRVSRTGRYKRQILLGLVTMVIGFVLVATLKIDSAMLYTVIFSVLLGLGIGPTNSLFVLAVQNAFPIAKLGTVTSANMFFRQMGGTLGVAVFGAMVAASLAGYARSSLPPGLETLPPAVIEEIVSPNLLTSPDQLELARQQLEGVAPAGSFDALVEGLRATLASALGQVFLVGAALAALALLAALFMPALELRGPTGKS